MSAPNVTLIPATKKMYEPKMGRKKLNVGAYCRVSTAEEEQHDSFENQVDHYTKMIEGKDEWNLVDIFGDEHAIIGTSGENLVKSRVSALVPFNFMLRASTISFKSQNIIMEGCANHVKNNRSMQ